MKFLLIAAAVVAVAVAGPTRFVNPGIAGPAPVVDQDGHPIQVGPAIIGDFHPIQVGPAIIDDFHPIQVGPAIIDDFHPIQVGPAIIDEWHPIQVGPAIVDDYHDIAVGPALIDFPVPESAITPTPVAPAPSNSPLVQIIVNVQQSQSAPAAPAAPPSKPVIVDTPAAEIPPTPVIVVEDSFPDYEPVLVADLPALPPVVAPEPVIVAPIIVAPVVVAPETLN